MTKRFETYKCLVCGNIVTVDHAGDGTLVCCGKEMKLLKEGETDGAQEKHVPVVEETTNGIKVKVGSAEHPMTEEHYIEWIECIANGNSYKVFLKPGDKPEAEFNVKADKYIVREYCNLHGLWKAEK